MFCTRSMMSSLAWSAGQSDAPMPRGPELSSGSVPGRSGNSGRPDRRFFVRILGRRIVPSAVESSRNKNIRPVRFPVKQAQSVEITDEKTPLESPPFDYGKSERVPESRRQFPPKHSPPAFHRISRRSSSADPDRAPGRRSTSWSPTARRGILHVASAKHLSHPRLASSPPAATPP